MAKEYERFQRSTPMAFNWYYERILEPSEEVMVKFPSVTPNARGVNDIAYTCDNDIILYGTIERDFTNDIAHWQEIMPSESVNKVTNAIKAVNSGLSNQRIIIRVLLN